MNTSMEIPVPKRVPIEKQAEVLATWLWENGPVKAEYAGQSADILAKVLTQRIPRVRSFTRTNALAVVDHLYEKGYVHKVGSTIIREVRWIGPNPQTLVWASPPNVRTKTDLLNRKELEDRVRLLYDYLRLDWEKS